MKKHVIRRLARFLQPYAWRLAVLTALLVATNLLSLAAPMLSGKAVGAVGIEAGTVDFAGVFATCGGMLAAEFLRARRLAPCGPKCVPRPAEGGL